MKQLSFKRLVLIVMIVFVIGTVTGCTTAENDAGSADPNKIITAEYTTMMKTVDQYPLQYNSYNQYRVKENSPYHAFGHLALKDKLLAPVVRNGNELITDSDKNFAISGFYFDETIGQWVVSEDKYGAVAANVFKQGCFSCKSSQFNQVYKDNGAEIFTQDLTDDFVKIINGQVWDCAICHGDEPGNEPDAHLTYWTQLARDTYDKFDSSERVCGQCHNSLDYRSHITDQKTMDGFSPYKYGTDIDSLYKAAIEDGIGNTDKDTGIVLSCLDHPDIEFTQNSPMRKMGVTCVSCHMTESTDQKSSTTYTSHNASGSPLENEDAMKYCLTCHKPRGIDSPEEMVKMVQDLQSKTAAEEKVLQDKFTKSYDLIKAANSNGNVDKAVLQKARDDYALAEAYFHAVVGSAELGVKVAHNPTATAKYNAQTGQLLDGIIAALK